jgi:hypothetical protein
MVIVGIVQRATASMHPHRHNLSRQTIRTPFRRCLLGSTPPHS